MRMESGMRERILYKYRIPGLLLVCIMLWCVVVLSACSGNSKEIEDETIQLSENEYRIYYLDDTGRALTSEIYTAANPQDEPLVLVKELWEAMKAPADSAHLSTAVRKEINIINISLRDEVLSVYFTDSYSNVQGSLCQDGDADSGCEIC